MAAVERDLLSGGKVSSVAEKYGISQACLCHHIAARGLAHTWTTAEERRLLTELRAGRAQIVRTDCVPAAARLAAAMETALSEFRSAASST